MLKFFEDCQFTTNARRHEYRMIRNDPLKKYWEEFGKRLKMTRGLMLLPRQAEGLPEILLSSNASIKKCLSVSLRRGVLFSDAAR